MAQRRRRLSVPCATARTVSDVGPRLDACDDEQTLRRWLSGDRVAGAFLFDKHAPAVRRFIAQRTTRDVDDLVQRTFLTCMAVGQRYRGDGNVRAFLLGIARNVLSAEWRDVKRRHDALVQWEQEQRDRRDELRVDDDASHEHALMAAMQQLPKALRAMLELLYWERLTRAEIARRLGVPEGTVASRSRLAHRLLRRTLVRARLRSRAR